MGDRANPIKFGPEWLRNLSSEPLSPGMHSSSGRDGTGTGPQGAAPPNNGPPPPHRHPNATNAPNTPKILLAKLRYGREEMLALYDCNTAEAPVQLKALELLYQSKGKPPYALNNTFEEDTRENMNRQPPMGGLPPGERYTGAGRGRSMMGMGDSRGRGMTPGDLRGKARAYNRQAPMTRVATTSWHTNPRNSYSGMPDDDPNQPLRPWGSNINSPSSGLRPTSEQPDWQNKQQQYRMKRQTSTNWRQQPNRDEGEEWRSSDTGRRPQEKWGNEWEWPENRGRPNQEKWHTNRRTWVGGDSNEDPLPEWAVDNADQCGGTFDSTGAFHGYSNDDTNLPKNQEAPFPLTRSHTHGSFARTKTAEEGSEEWWASEKAKKLSPKRFDASEIKFKKATSPIIDEEKPNSTSGQSSGANGQSTGAIPKVRNTAVSRDKSSKDYKMTRKSSSNDKDDDNADIKKHESKERKDKKQPDNMTKDTFDSRFENNDVTAEEKANFQSSMLAGNNVLRQNLQSIAGTPTETSKRQPSQGKMLQFFDQANQARQLEKDDESQKEKENKKLVDDILQMNLEGGLPMAAIDQMLTNHSSTTHSHAQLPNSPMQMRMPTPLGLGINSQNKQNMQGSSPLQQSDMQSRLMRPIGITNSMLNASLGLPMPNSSSNLPLPNMSNMSNSGLSNPSMLASGLQGIGVGSMTQSGLQGSSLASGQGPMSFEAGLQMSNLQGNGMPGLQSSMQAGGPVMANYTSASVPIPGMNNSSLFNNVGMQNNNDMSNSQNMFQYQQPATQSFSSSMYANMMSQPPPPLQNLGMQHNMSSDQWYYEDPNKTIQGPFSSKEMFNWYRAGFFSPTLMVRRACEAVMRPLGNYGHMPFGQMDMLPPFPMSGGFDLRPQQAHDNIMNPQQGLGIDVSAYDGFPFRPPFSGPSVMTYSSKDTNFVIHSMPVKSLNRHNTCSIPVPGPLPFPPFQFVQNNKVESLWGQPSNNTAGQDLMWMQAMNNNSHNDNHINNLPMYFWENKPNLPANPLLPEEMKTEDDILAQIRASQIPLSFLTQPPPPPPPATGDDFTKAALDMANLQKLIRNEESNVTAGEVDDVEQKKAEKPAKEDQSAEGTTKVGIKVDTKSVKEAAKVDKQVKPKETAPKPKKKAKEEKKEETTETKTDEEEVKIEARSAEPSPTPKNKKDEKLNKKDLEKEKKEWIKEGFTIVAKGAEKTNKDSKKKSEETKAVEEAERKRKEEEKIAAEEKKRQLETIKKQQEMQNQEKIQRQAAESIMKKAPWSSSSLGLQAPSRDGLTLSEIQRLEREKKLEQMKEQQQMMQLIAHQQAVALAREQEMQAGLGWAKKLSPASASQTLAEIQAEARMQAAAAAAATAVMLARDEVLVTPPLINNLPWGNSVHNGNGGGGGFWDSPPPPPEPIKPIKPMPKPVEPPKPIEPKPKKKVTVMTPLKKITTPSSEFDTWCNDILSFWRDSSIDIPTFVAFLRDIESPYEVKDYVKCYLGDTREATDFARQFLEKRSRLLRVGMETPSDDLCSPAAAINPRTNSGSDYTEVKNKGKKTKKNKMVKLDARILGFSVTASEDRINVGDIDTV